MLLQVLEIDKYTEIDSGRICFSVFVSLEYDNLQFRYRCILHVRPTLYRAPGFCWRFYSKWKFVIDSKDKDASIDNCRQ